MRGPDIPTVAFASLYAALLLVGVMAVQSEAAQDQRACGTVVPDCPTFEATMSQLFRAADCIAPEEVARTIDAAPSWTYLGPGRRSALRKVRDWATRCGYRPLEPSTAQTVRVIR